ALRRGSTAVAAVGGEWLSDLVGSGSAGLQEASGDATDDIRDSRDDSDEDSSSGRGKRMLLILLVVGALAAIVRAVMARQAEQDAAALWQTGEGFSTGSVPAGHDDADSVVSSDAAGSTAASDAAGATPEEALADTALADETTTVTETGDLGEGAAGPLGEGQVDLRDEGTRGKHTRS
ncbi:MAG: hypothetical protein ACTHMW_05810, partial [Actinomycetes bacterium]